MLTKLTKASLFTSLYIGWICALSGQQLTLFPDIVVKGDPDVIYISPTPDGNYLVSSTLDHVNGHPCGNLAKIDASGNLINSFNRVIVDDQLLKSLSLPDGKILIGGWFGHVNGVAASLARLSADGTIDNAFQVLAFTATSQYVSSFVVQADGKIVVAGSFLKNGYQDLIRLNSNGTVDNTFASFTSPLGYLSGIVLDRAGNIFVSDAHSVFKLNANGSALSGFPVSVNSSGYFFNIHRYGEKVIIGGDFTTIGSANRKNLAIINGDGTIDPFTVLNAPAVEHIAATGTGQILVSDLNTVRVYDTNGTELSTIASNRPNRIFIDSAQRILVTGGSLLMTEATSHPYIARFNSDLTADNSFVCHTTYTSGITAIASQPDGRILIGGDYTVAGINSSDKRLARINPSGTVDNSFNPDISSSGAIRSLAIQSDGKILVCSDKLFRLNSSGSSDNTFAIANKNPVDPLAVMSKVKLKGEGIYLSGAFDKINTFESPGIVKLTSNGTIDNSFISALPLNSYVTDFAFQSDNKIIVSGTFSFNGDYKSLIRLHENGSLDDSFTKGTQTANGIWRIAVDSHDNIYLSGNFIDYNGVTLDRFMRLSPEGTLDLTFTPTLPLVANGTVEGLELLSDDEIVLGARLLYGKPALAQYNASGVLMDKVFTHLGENSSISTSFFNGETLYFGGRLVSEDNTTISGVSYLNIHPVTGTITDLQGSRTVSTQSHLTWTNNIDYGSLLIIERSLSNNTNFVPIDSIPAVATSYDDSGILGSMGYYYRIRAINTSSSAGYSNEFYLAPKLEQTIEFAPLIDKTYGDTTFPLNATASSGLTVTFSSSDVSLASIENSILTIHKAGSVVIAANAPGNDVYYAATVQRTLTINKENQAITFEMIQQKKSGDPPFSVSAIASSGLSVQILSSDESVASVNGMTITILKGGEITLTANQTGDENYLPASPVTRPLKIVNVIVMVNEIDTSSASVYPNPGKGLFSISEASRFDGGTCSIISSDGTLKDQLQVTLNQGTMDLNLTKLVAGLYLIRIENGKQKGYFKVIKE